MKLFTMNTNLLKVAIRKNAIIIPNEWILTEELTKLNETSFVLLANSSKLGYTFSEDLLEKINVISPKCKMEILELLKEVTGVKKNWTPLVKQWDIPTGETVLDHIATWFENIFHTKSGTELLCGHFIPDNTFPLERYNGCPFCGTPFQFDDLDYSVDKNKLKVLNLWTEKDLQKYLSDLFESTVALDATQVDDIKMLIANYGVGKDANIKMKETLMLVIDHLIDIDNIENAGKLFNSPNDILRYLWYKHTGFLQIVEPKTIANRIAKNSRNLHYQLDNSTKLKIKSLQELKLKFNRSECKQYALWLNNLNMSILDQCESMHPKRGIWVRVIRALRLGEYSKRKGFENLAQLLETFYHEKYEVWQGSVNKFKLKMDSNSAFELLKQRPGLFARSLFSTMLWFGPNLTIEQFNEILDQVPMRLVFTLNMYADIYFDRHAQRTVKPLGGTNKKIPSNKLLQIYSDSELTRMKSLVQELSMTKIKRNLEKVDNDNETMFIDDNLFNTPIAIGDRSEHIQDLSGALVGTRMKVEGDTVRLFLQWGEGLPAQHLDMDLSCQIAYKDKIDFCSYSQLSIPGCKHSGDIQYIPQMVGTAEYIDIDIANLQDRGARYVSFTCNAYSNGSIVPNLVVGWMNSKHTMKISKSGVAYNPTHVQQQIRIKRSLTKGLVFGVLDVQRREIIWLEMSFGGQTVQNLDFFTIEALIKKLDAKLKIGDLLKLKAEVQGLEIVDSLDVADEVYDIEWALNTAEVSNLFL